ncbi:zinc finger and SCAN domain-containing protein 5C [Trematomus bernacchii]|uniref:zinc finger and SCAN domain-containing protein 5C n=1 Tax=Trematomus bernacchii TaxID=40690 RepID=UPI00146CC144|nr:zinc finger and SCAN domain-containing protein 5C [Trematomus bernacchii]
MSDLDTLIVTFQTQLSDVMETVVKTAMFEVTRLVEDGFLEEMQRRNQEVEALRMELQWAERKIRDQGGNTGKCVDCAKDAVKLCSDTAEEMPKEQQDEVLEGCGVKEEEGDSGESWKICSTQEVLPESTQEADPRAATLSPERRSTTTGEEDRLPMVDVKEEEVNNHSNSSVHWSDSLYGEEGPQSHSSTEMAQPKHTQENTEELFRNVIKQDSQISFSALEEEAHVVTNPSLEVDDGWAIITPELIPNHRLSTEIDCDLSKISSPTVTVDVVVTPERVHMLSSRSPKAALQNSDASCVTIKQEVVDSDGYVESEPKGKKKSRMTSFSCLVKRHRVSLEALRQNHISHKGTGLKMHGALQHFHRPTKKPAHANSYGSPLSVAHVGNPLNRTPSTSKSAPSPFPQLSLQRGQQAQNRTAAPWVSVKTDPSENSHHANPLPHPDSGPRHLLRCGQCGRCFPHPSNLKAHLQTHTGERPFCCALCGRSFTKLSNLKAHRRVHTGERPYCCMACGKRFTQNCNLKRHQRIHLDV